LHTQASETCQGLILAVVASEKRGDSNTFRFFWGRGINHKIRKIK
jgi:hypothetical protein